MAEGIGNLFFLKDTNSLTIKALHNIITLFERNWGHSEELGVRSWMLSVKLVCHIANITPLVNKSIIFHSNANIFSFPPKSLQASIIVHLYSLVILERFLFSFQGGWLKNPQSPFGNRKCSRCPCWDRNFWRWSNK